LCNAWVGGGAFMLGIIVRFSCVPLWGIQF
jgi:hypothetical protein